MNEKLIKLTKDLISFKTEVGEKKEISKCIDYICDYFKDFKSLKTYRGESNGFEYLVLSPSRKPKVYLSAHIDVIPAKVEQYQPKIAGNKLFGRGASDMKGQLAGMMVAFKNILKEGNKSVGLMVTSDEEQGGANGVEHLVKNGFLPKLAIVPDGGANFTVIRKQKGVLHLEITAKGKSVHGSRVWLGDNAIEKLMNCYFKIKSMFPKVDRQDNWRMTLNLGTISGGSSINTVAGEAKMGLDIRYTENDDIDLVYKKIKEICGEDIEAKILNKEPVSVIDQENELIKKSMSVLKRDLGDRVKVGVAHGASDGRFFNQKGIPYLMFKPDSGGHHGDKEWIDIEGLDLFSKVIQDILEVL